MFGDEFEEQPEGGGRDGKQSMEPPNSYRGRQQAHAAAAGESKHRHCR